MVVTPKEEADLQSLFEAFNTRYGGRKEDYFGALYLLKKFKGEAEDVLHQVVVGKSVYGIDGYFLDSSLGNLYLFQFRWTDNHNQFRDSLDQLAAAGLERVFDAGIASATQDPVITRLRADLYEYKSAINRVFIQLVFKGKVDAAEQSAGLQQRREAVEAKRHIIEQYFQKPVDLVFEYVADRRIVVPPPPSTHEIAFGERVTHTTGDGKRLHLGFVLLVDLVEIYRTLGQRFLDRNIRSGLSPDKSSNRHIREALAAIVLKKDSDPDAFVFNHNGITLAVEEVTFGEGTAVLKIPRLLNGAQTITTADRFVSEFSESPQFKSGREELARIRLLTKLVEHPAGGPGDTFITTVTVCNNRQNPVDPWHLRANDQIQCDFQDKLREDLGIFYSRQENAFDNLSDEDLDDLNIGDIRDVRIKPLAQTFLAVQGEIDKMSRLPEVFENQKVYEDTFRDSYLKADSRRIILAYKIGTVLNSPVKRMVGDSPQWLQPALGRARSLIWALLIQSFLNDDKLDDLLDQYGTTLSKQLSFRTLASSYAANRLLPILRHTLSEPSYRAKIDDEKYAFLRTKELFKRCMGVASEQFGWSKRSF